MPKDNSDNGNGIRNGLWVLIELARREQFLFKSRDIDFYWIEDLNCMKKYGGVDTSAPDDALVMFSREQDKEKNWEQNAPLLNKEDTRHMQKLNRWVNTVISDVQRTFTDRIIHTIMDEKMFALVLIRSGGLPRTDEDFEVMLPDDLTAVTAFNKFSKMIKFKQQRALVFYADPF